MTNEEMDRLQSFLESGDEDEAGEVSTAAFLRLLARARRANELEAEVRKAKAEGLADAAQFVESCTPPPGAGSPIVRENFRLMVERLVQLSVEAHLGIGAYKKADEVSNG